MSHTVKIKTAFKSLRCLKKAFQRMGWEVKEKVGTRLWGGVQDKYNWTAVNPKGTMDIGILDNLQKKELELYTDLYDQTIEQQLGVQMAKLKQTYQELVIEDELIPQGYTISREVLANGSIVIHADKA